MAVEKRINARQRLFGQAAGKRDEYMGATPATRKRPALPACVHWQP